MKPQPSNSRTRKKLPSVSPDRQKFPSVRCAHDSLEPTESIKPHPKNPNRHTKEQVSLLARILTEQGWRLPIVVSKRSGLIVAGHARLEAAIQLGLKQCPVNF